MGVSSLVLPFSRLQKGLDHSGKERSDRNLETCKPGEPVYSITCYPYRLLLYFWTLEVSFQLRASNPPPGLPMQVTSRMLPARIKTVWNTQHIKGEARLVPEYSQRRLFCRERLQVS